MTYYGKQPPYPWPESCQPPAQPPSHTCPQEPGTVLRIYIPAGTVVNLANLLEITSPAGICLLVRIPVLSGNLNLDLVLDAIRNAGGSVEFV